MAEEFEFRDLSDAEFWGVDLSRARFRDVDLDGAQITHSRLTDVVIDAEIGGLVINGVDVTDYVNERDEWFVLRSTLHPTEPGRMREGWQAFLVAWEGVIERAEALPDRRRHASVDGEWSFVQTVRHVVFATDKWFTVPVLAGRFHPLGLPNTGSLDFGWPGVEADAEPTFDEAVAAWRDRGEQLRGYLEDVSLDALDVEVEVLENGVTAVHDCIGVVFEEHFQHLRYALRDLDRLAGSGD
jgi:hypothetical protein